MANTFALPYHLSKVTKVTCIYIPNCGYCAIAKPTLIWLGSLLTYNFQYELRQAGSVPENMEVGTLGAMLEDGRDYFATYLVEAHESATPETIIGDIGLEDGKIKLIRGCDSFFGSLRDIGAPKEVIMAALKEEELKAAEKYVGIGGLNGITYATEIYKYYENNSNIVNTELAEYLAKMTLYRQSLLKKVETLYLNLFQENNKTLRKQ